jgi:hypothetical protein
MMSSKTTITTEDILRDHTAPVQRIAAQLRRVIHETGNSLVEKAYPGWHGIGFRHPRAGYVCGIFPLDDSVRLLFEKGRLLSDPEGILMGDGKQTRYIEFHPGEEIEADTILRFLLEAVSL